jgi:serine phosphatase RsbU (regulator of sigma subunit)
MTYDELVTLFAFRMRAFETRDVETLVASYSDDGVLESPASGKIVGRAAIDRAFRNMFAAIPDIRLEDEGLIVMGDQVVQIGTATGTDTGGFLGQSPTGKPFSVPVVRLFVMDGQAIVRERRVYDFSGLLLQRVQTELEVAAKIQRALLPVGQLTHSGCELATASIPCRMIGGDFFDSFDLPDGALGLAFGDVAGKGPPAALLAAMLQGVFATEARYGGTPAATVGHVNRAMLRRAIEARFATALYASVSADGVLTYCNAGHNPPILIGMDRLLKLTTGGPVVGMLENAVYLEETLRLDRGDTLIVHSDGITEALSAAGEEFGDDRLVSCVQSHRESSPGVLRDAVLDAVRGFTAGALQNDDLSVLVLRYSGPANG